MSKFIGQVITDKFESELEIFFLWRKRRLRDDVVNVELGRMMIPNARQDVVYAARGVAFSFV